MMMKKGMKLRMIRRKGGIKARGGGEDEEQNKMEKD